jgi:hypothetical protein
MADETKTPQERIKELFGRYKAHAPDVYGGIPDFYNNYPDHPEYYRVIVQKAIFDILKGLYDIHIYQQMKSRYEVIWDEYAAFLGPKMNPLKRVVKALATVYKKAPSRYARTVALTEDASDTKKKRIKKKNEKLDTFLSDHLVDANRSLRMANEYANAKLSPLVWAYIYDEDGKPLVKTDGSSDFSEHELRFRFRILPGHLQEADTAQDYKLDVIAYWDDRDRWACSIYDEVKKRRRQFWFNPSAEGDDVSKVTEAIDLAEPVYATHKPYNGREAIWEVWELLGLARGTLSQGERESFEERVAFLKSFKQLVGEDSKTTDINIGPGNIVNDPDLDAIDLVDKDLMMLEMVEKYAQMLAADWGLSSLSFFGDYKSSQDITTVSMEARLRNAEQLEDYKEIERQVWRAVLTKAVEFQLLPEEALKWRVQTDFAEPSLLLEPDKALKKFEEEERLGLTNILEEIKTRKESITTDSEAMAYYESNQDIRAKRIEYNRKLEQSMKPAPTNPNKMDTHGDSPEENGRKAQETLHKIKGDLTGPEGAGGPVMTTKKEVTGESFKQTKGE